MNPNRPGWQTSEFWIALVSQVLSLLVIAGYLSASDRSTLEGALANGIASAFAFASSAAVVIGYIQSRTALKQGIPPVSPRAVPSVLPLALIGLLLLPGSAPAQSPGQRTCLLPWRADVERRLRDLQQPRTDPALAEALRQIAENQRQILALLQQRQGAPPTGTPQIIILGGPYQQLPIAGLPKQELPIQGPPRQELPVEGQPRQELPIPGQPRQELPPAGPPQQVLPGETKPRQGLPQSPSMPPASARPPAGYQRYLPASAWRPFIQKPSPVATR